MSGSQACGPADGCQHDIAVALRRLDDGGRAGSTGDSRAGQGLLQRASASLIGQSRESRTKAPGNMRQRNRIAPADHSFNAEFVAMGQNHVRG
jgi:hypothetical protein